MLAPTLILAAALAIVAVLAAAVRARTAGEPARPRVPFWRWLWGGLAVLSLAFAALFAFAFYEQYWRWRDCFNELGRCYDSAESVVYLEQAGMIWGGLAGIALIAAAVFTLLSCKD